MTKLAFASDHAGVELKDALKTHAAALGFEVIDLGTQGTASVDYPRFGQAMGDAIATGRAEKGVLVCGTGIGISIAANRNPAVRAALCHDATTAKLAREHNDANVLALGARIVGLEVAKDCLTAFLRTEFAGGRHAARVAMLSDTPA
jgi:ribose 5-phosphate isomerase B